MAARKKRPADEFEEDPPKAGHNSEGIAGDALLSYIERIERNNEAAKELSEDNREILSEAKGNGFDVKMIRKIVAIRRQDKDTRREEEEILGLYMAAIGMT